MTNNKLFFALFALIGIICISSCTNDTVKAEEEIRLNSVDGQTGEYVVDGSTLVSILNPENEALYGFYGKTDGNISNRENTGNIANLIKTSGGTYIYFSDGSPINFSMKDMGINSLGTLQIIKYDTDHDDYIINTSTDRPIFIDNYGERVFEEYYRIPLDDIEDKSKVALMTTQKSQNATMSTDIKVVKAGDKYFLPDNERDGILDLSGVDELMVFSQIEIARGSTIRGVIAQSPITITENNPITLKAPQVYEIEKTDKELVLEIELTESIKDYNLYSSAVNSRYYDGTRKPYVFPIKYEYDKNKNTVLLYVGNVENNFIFDFDMRGNTNENAGTATLREIKKEEKDLIHYIDPSEGTVTITFTKDQYYVPVIFRGNDADLREGYIKAFSISNDNFLIRCGHVNGYGFSYDQIANGNIFDLNRYSPCILEHGYIINSNGRDGSLTLQFSKDGKFPPLYEEIEFRKEKILKANEIYRILPDNRELVLEIDLGENDFEAYDLRVNVINSQYINGTRKSNMFPLSYDVKENKVLVYIGKVDKEFCFPLEINYDQNYTINEENVGTAILREITAEEKNKIHYINPIQGKVKINMGNDYYTPIIFEGNTDILSGGYVDIEFSSEDYWIKFASSDGYGYYSRSFNNQNNTLDGTERPNYALEFAFIRNHRQKEGIATLSFRR